MAANVKKKASPAQVAARKRFAEMARSGAFKGRRKKSAPKARVKSRAVPSPAQLAARKKFVAMVRARAKAKKKNGTMLSEGRRNSRGFSSAPPAWTRSKPKKKKRGTLLSEKNPLRFKTERAFEAFQARTGKQASPAPRKRATRSKKRTAGSLLKSLGRGIATGLRTRAGVMSLSRSARNPSPASVFSEFRGKPVRSSTKGFAARGTPAKLASLGKLKELSLRGKKLRFGGRATLAASGRKHLYIANVRMKRANPPGEIDYGEIVSVTYYADKPHIETGSFNYEHKFSRPLPRLIVDEEGCPKIEGGGYTITEDGIEK